MDPDRSQPGIFVTNGGLGPAIIRRIVLSIDGLESKEVSMQRQWRFVLEKLALPRLNAGVKAVEPGACLAPGGRLTLCSWQSLRRALPSMNG
jgi:hypothetical protein